MSEQSERVQPDTDESRFAENMRRARESKGWSQGEMARQMRDAGWATFHQTTISRMEKGERPVRLGEARVIASLLDTGVSRLVQPVPEARLTDALLRATGEVRDAYDGIEQRTEAMLAAHESLSYYVADAERLGVVPAAQPAREGTIDAGFWLQQARDALELTPEQAVRWGRDERALFLRGQDQADELRAELADEEAEALAEQEGDDGEHPEAS